MRRNVTIVVALVLAAVGLLGFATGAFVAIGCVVLVLSCALLAVMLGIGGPEDDDQTGPPEK
ncbi:MAG: hypothetical protein JST53_09620 [Actinobacteria bacterium]|nr:hypothetical protein [Actinomycetota bacterium]